MYLKKEKGRIRKLVGIFFAGMLLFTLLSRAVYQHGTAVVTTAAPTSGAIAHTVQLTGKTLQNQEQAVTTVAGLRVASICVNEGQQVNQGDVLFTLDLDYLEETILTQKQDMEKQRLSVQDAWSQNAATQKRRSNAQAQAEENYNSAVAQAETALERAARNLERAKAALENYYNGITEDKAQEEALVSECQKAKSDYDAALAALELLQQEIADKIQEAIDRAEQERAQAPQQETVPEVLPPAEPVPQTDTLTQAEIDDIANAVRAEYAQRLSDARSAVEQARQAVDETNAALEAYRQEQQTGSPVRSEQELLEAVEKAQQTYDDALSALENAKTTYGRAIRSANLPDGSNHTAQIGQITYDQMALALDKLEALLDGEGKILSPVDGIVTRCNIQTGEKTTDTTAMLLADLSQGCKFSGLVTEEQSKYIGLGDRVTLRAGSTGKRYEDLPVTTFSPSEETEGGYRLTVQLPANTLSLGASAELSFTRKSQPYSCCVPVSALHLDVRNQPYVLVVEQVNTVLGPQQQARKVSVTVLEQNETTAALAEGALSSKQQVIVGSDRAVDIGSRVRVS
ncbi:MAG: biotin/lipoyl-binding protein [Candidatus Faecousia sp.]|nr:biotin/lipoyl-binding protein [Candidatus Faecousia sp.]